MLAIHDILLKHEIIKTMNPGLINTAAELHRGNTEQIGFSRQAFGFSDFLEEISSLSHSVVFLYFFALIVEEGFHISSCYSLEPCIQMFISFLFSFAFHFSPFLSYL